MRTKEKQIEWLEYLYKKNSFAFWKAMGELIRRGMTDDELHEFVDDINLEYARLFQNEKWS